MKQKSDSASQAAVTAAAAAPVPTPVLERTLGTIARVLGAHSVYVERAPAPAGPAEVVASFGPLAPPAGERAPEPGAVALLIPLEWQEAGRGALVALRSARAAAADPVPARELELVSALAALALRNLDLEREAAAVAADAGERHYRLLAGATHHLRNLLGAASEYTQLLDTEGPLTPRQHEYIRASRRNVDTAVRLMTELVDLGRVETGRLPLELLELDVGLVIRGLLADHGLTAEQRGVGLEARLEPALPPVRGDLDTLRTVLETLVTNAFRYAPPGTAVTIAAGLRAGRRAGDPSGWVCVSVSDRGPGVAEREDVFEEVARVEPRVSPGLRLAICRRLARALRGDLTLEQDAGTTFTLWLPATGANAPPVTAPPPAAG